MYHCSVSFNEQCCEARQVEGTSDFDNATQGELTRNIDMGAFLPTGFGSGYNGREGNIHASCLYLFPRVQYEYIYIAGM